MRETFTRIACVLLLLPILGGCDLADVGDAIIVPDVEDEFYVDIWEDLSTDNGGRALILKIESIHPENCLNYSIDYRFDRTGNRLTVSLVDLREPADCEPGEAPVTADVNIGSLPSGNYAMNIDFRNTVENSGQLLVSPERYFLTMKTQNGIVLLREELLRVPENMIWGYVALQGAEAAAAAAFLEDLQAISDQPTGMREGYYGYFTIHSADSEVFVQDQPMDGSARTFLLEYTGTQNNLKGLLADYRLQYGDQLPIRLMNAKGEVL